MNVAGADVAADSTQRFLVLETAKKLNELIRRNSPSASLVVTHLPIPHKVSEAGQFMEYVDAMFEEVDNQAAAEAPVDVVTAAESPADGSSLPANES